MAGSNQSSESDMGVLDADLDSVSRKLLTAVDEVRALEAEKRGTARSTEDFHNLADEVAAKAGEVFAIANFEEATGERDSPDPAERSEQKPGDWTDQN